MRINLVDSVVEATKALAVALLTVDPDDRVARAILDAIETSRADLQAADRGAIIETASRLFCNDDVEIDADAVFSRGDDGVWVAAWVHVAHAELGADEADGDDRDEDDPPAAFAARRLPTI